MCVGRGMYVERRSPERARGASRSSVRRAGVIPREGGLPIITLTTDFGQRDGYVGVMKGVILGIAPHVSIVDISHEIPPQDVREAAYILSTAVPYFPSGTIHVVVVDPGVGSARRPIAIRTPTATFVAPDNGVLSFVLAEHARAEVRHLDRPRFWLSQISRTFHGRDIFTPVAAHLAAGVPFGEVGTVINDPVTISLPRPQRTADGAICGEVLHVDRFGNLITDIPADWLAGAASWRFEVAGQSIDGLSHAYAAVEPGALVALIGSAGRLEIAVCQGSAATFLGVAAGASVVARPMEVAYELSVSTADIASRGH